MENWMMDFIQEMTTSLHCMKYLGAIKAMVPLYTDIYEEAIRRFNIMKNIYISETIIMSFNNIIEDGSYYVFITRINQQN